MYSKYWLAGLVSGVLMACGGKSTTPEVRTAAPAPAEATEAANMPQTARPSVEEPSAYTPAVVPSMQPPPAVEPPPMPLTDGQVAAITDAANTAEVEQGALAQARAKDPRVKHFATMMMNDHSQAKKQQADLLQRIGIKAIDSRKSDALEQESNNAIESLKELNRNEFDRAYIDMQVSGHQKVLDSLDNELIPNTKNAEFKAALSEFRPKVEDHLREAQDIQQALATESPMQPIGIGQPHQGKRSVAAFER